MSKRAFDSFEIYDSDSVDHTNDMLPKEKEKLVESESSRRALHKLAKEVLHTVYEKVLKKIKPEVTTELRTLRSQIEDTSSRTNTVPETSPVTKNIGKKETVVYDFNNYDRASDVLDNIHHAANNVLEDINKAPNDPNFFASSIGKLMKFILGTELGEKK